MSDDIRLIIGITAGSLSLIAYILYNIAILRGTTRPSRATWWILTLVGFLILASYYSEGARTTIWVPLAYFIGPLVIALLSLKYGRGGWTRLDRFCFAGAVVSMVFWFLTSSALIALLINIFIDFLGLLPTIKKSYRWPRTEDKTAWIFEAVASLINLFAIQAWTFEIYVYPLYLVIVNGLIAMLLIRKKHRRRLK